MLARKKYFWTTTEIALLKNFCASGESVTEVESILPGRSSVAIYQKAKEMGFLLPSAKGVSGDCWSKNAVAANDSIDTILKDALGDHSQKDSLKDLSKKLNIPAWQLSRRAGSLGLTKPRLKEERWSGQEIDIVDLYGEDGVPEVARQLKAAGFYRTNGSIGTKIKRREIEKLANSAMSARAIAELMGVDGKTVVRWIELLGLKSKQVDGVWRVNKKDLKRWLLSNPDAFNLKKVHQIWFMGLIGGIDDLYNF